MQIDLLGYGTKGEEVMSAPKDPVKLAEWKRNLSVANKGRARTEETRKRMSESAKKRAPISEETRKKRSESLMGEKHPMFGKHHSEETRKKLSESLKGKMCGSKNPMFGKHPSEEARLKMSLSHKGKNSGEKNPMFGKPGQNLGKRMSEETKRKLSAALTGKYRGEKCPQWKGGVSFEPYCQKFTKEFKERVRAFFWYRCVECGSPQNEMKLAVHHVTYNKSACCDNNVPLFVALCQSCHMKTGRNREYWKQHFTDMLVQYYGGKSYFTKEEFEQYSNGT